MAEIIERGKQQVLFNYLPGRTFDFKKYVVAKVEKVRGQIFQRLNASLVIRKISEQARAWPEEHRPLLRDDILRDEFRFARKRHFECGDFQCHHPFFACAACFDRVSLSSGSGHSRAAPQPAYLRLRRCSCTFRWDTSY